MLLSKTKLYKMQKTVKIEAQKIKKNTWSVLLEPQCTDCRPGFHEELVFTENLKITNI